MKNIGLKKLDFQSLYGLILEKPDTGSMHKVDRATSKQGPRLESDAIFFMCAVSISD